jgi:hypothetical protein
VVGWFEIDERLANVFRPHRVLAGVDTRQCDRIDVLGGNCVAHITTKASIPQHRFDIPVVGEERQTPLLIEEGRSACSQLGEHRIRVLDEVWGVWVERRHALILVPMDFVGQPPRAITGRWGQRPP